MRSLAELIGLEMLSTAPQLTRCLKSDLVTSSFLLMAPDELAGSSFLVPEELLLGRGYCEFYFDGTFGCDFFSPL